MPNGVRCKVVGDKYVGEVLEAGGDVWYSTDPFADEAAALRAAQTWAAWCNEVANGRGQSIYYILGVPETWPGPPPGAHPYTGLNMKIGRATDVLKRWQNLQTGTPERLIIHALEPGSARLEKQRHQEFASDRRQGEWFACSDPLARHMIQTWWRHRVLPKAHQFEVLNLIERIKILRAVRQVFEGAPDQINPSLNDPWHGKVLVDLVYANRRVK